MRVKRQAASLLSLCLLVCQGTPADAADPTPEQVDFFESKIRPVLVRECYSCHSNQTGNAKGGLRLDNARLMQIGGDSGPAVVAGDVESSLLISALEYDEFAMPPSGPLSASVVADFRRWVEMGAPDPRATKPAQFHSQITDRDIAEAKRNFWAYRQPESVEPPQVQDRSWPRGPIDLWVLAQLEQESLAPPADAEPHQILRRLCNDLVGLPPTPEQVEYFAARWGVNPDAAIEHVVDRLLESPRFGERWGRHWLDLARYAESNGRELNQTLPHAWRYRDYVIDSFNEDKPFDRFAAEQIAGDLLPVAKRHGESFDEQWAEQLVATGFLALGPKALGEQNGVQFQADLIDEQIDTTTRVFLATSVACARCHDHKFDAIPQTDYYALAGIFASTATYYGTPASEYGNFGGIQNRNNSNLIRLPVDDPNPFDRSLSPDEIAAYEQDVIEAGQQLIAYRRSRRQGADSSMQPALPFRDLLRIQNQLRALSTTLGSVDEEGRPLSFCMGVQDQSRPRDIPLLVRGEIDQPTEPIRRDFPRVLRERPPRIDDRSSGRLALAQWIGSDANPLTARVMSNRVWKHLIGEGLVRTTENFGATGQPPSHPELLDHLAVRFVQSGWSVKSLIRQIATSRTYRMSSRFDAAAFQQDPDNRWLWRAHPRRLDAESIRDGMLMVADAIEWERPRASEVAAVGYTVVRNDLFQEEQLDNVRSVYLPVIRDQVPRGLEVFDFAEPSLVIGQRETSNTANQALYMLNSDFVRRQSERVAMRALRQAESTGQRVDLIFLWTLARPPHQSERAAAIAYLDRQSAGEGGGRLGITALANFCHAVLASAEFRFLD